MKRPEKSAVKSLATFVASDKFVPRVTKLEKNKYAAYVDLHVDHLWDMALQGSPVRICKKRKSAEKAALALLAIVRRQDGAGRKRA